MVSSSGQAGTSTGPGVSLGGGSRRPREAEVPVVRGLSGTSTSETISASSTVLSSASSGGDDKGCPRPLLSLKILQGQGLPANAGS